MKARAPVLVLASGNPSRGDDALGPEFARRLEAARADAIARGELEVLTDFQLNVEHALDLEGRRRVYFVDASVEPGVASFEVRPVCPEPGSGVSTHRLSPEAVLHTCQVVLGLEPPEALVVAIKGERFELGEPLSEAAERNLEEALAAFPAAP